MSGNKGIKKFTPIQSTYSLPRTGEDGKNPTGIRGYMNKNISIFSFNTSHNLFISNELDTLSDNQFASTGGMDGNAIGYVDATANNNTKDIPDPGVITEGPNYNPTLLAFANRMVIKPVHNEVQNISYFDKAAKKLYIK